MADTLQVKLLLPHRRWSRGPSKGAPQPGDIGRGCGGSLSTAQGPGGDRGHARVAGDSLGRHLLSTEPAEAHRSRRPTA